MTVIWSIIVLMSSLAVYLPNAYGSPINHAKEGIHRRNNPTEDEFEFLHNYDEISIGSDDLEDFYLRYDRHDEQSVTINKPPDVQLEATQPLPLIHLESQF